MISHLMMQEDLLAIEMSKSPRQRRYEYCERHKVSNTAVRHGISVHSAWWHSCGRKIIFLSKEDAQHALDTFENLRDDRNRPYLCDYGPAEHWHFGHPESEDYDA